MACGYTWSRTIRIQSESTKERATKPLRAKRLIPKESLVAFRDVAPQRSTLLFTEFLPIGYEAMTLSSVTPQFRERLLAAKLHLGMLITLYDDLADSPRWANSRLLHELYKLPFHADSIRNAKLNTSERKVVELARHLAEGTFPILKSLPHFRVLGSLLHFDLQQFYNANRYCELLTRIPFLANSEEGATYINHNMGMVIIGMMDLMGSPGLRFDELGEMRALFLKGQRVGRICNVLTTLNRELSDGDITNELIIEAIQSKQAKIGDLSTIKKHQLAESKRRLRDERKQLYSDISTKHNTIKTFNVRQYRAGLKDLQQLHEVMEGIL